MIDFAKSLWRLAAPSPVLACLGAADLLPRATLGAAGTSFGERRLRIPDSRTIEYASDGIGVLPRLICWATRCTVFALAEKEPFLSPSTRRS